MIKDKRFALLYRLCAFVFAVAAFYGIPVLSDDGNIIASYQAGKGLSVENGQLLQNGTEWRYSLKDSILNILT